MLTRADLPQIHITRRAGPTLLGTVRVAGRILLVAGLVVAGFLAQQLWLTSALAQRAQGGLSEALDERIAATAPIEVVYEPADLPASPFQADAAALEGASPAAAPFAGTPERTVPEAAAAPAGTGAEPESPAATLVTEPAPERGEPMARLVVPAAGIDWTVVEGADRADLRSGAGHMPETALPGQPGNAVFSGHRTTYGAPFQHLDRLAPGDLVTVETASGTHVFAVVESLIVEPRDTWVTDQWRGSWLTLTTCHPRFAATERLVVVSRLVDGPNADILARS